jgi:hypothetical protein
MAQSYSTLPFMSRALFWETFFLFYDALGRESLLLENKKDPQLRGSFVSGSRPAAAFQLLLPVEFFL